MRSLNFGTRGLRVIGLAHLLQAGIKSHYADLQFVQNQNVLPRVDEVPTLQSYIISYHIIYHIISEIYSAPITKRT